MEIQQANNTANDTGGGVYLDMSELHCQGNNSLKLLGNVATVKGGGVHAISSTINVEGNSLHNKNVTDEATYSGALLYSTKMKLREAEDFV